VNRGLKNVPSKFLWERGWNISIFDKRNLSINFKHCLRNLPDIGRIFFAIAIAIMGLQTIWYDSFPYMMIPPKHSGVPGIEILAYVFGALLSIVGVGIAFNKKIKPLSLLLGSVLLLIFCFCFMPYEFITDPNFQQFGEWENAEKELALSGGAFVIAGCFSGNPPWRFWTKLVASGPILFALTIICFGTDHLLYIKDAADYIPTWIPGHIFWAYFTGLALIGSGVAIVLKINPRLIASLLGVMILSWVVILHIPLVIASPFAHKGSEVTSASLALAYSGIAFVIAGQAKK